MFGSHQTSHIGRNMCGTCSREQDYMFAVLGEVDSSGGSPELGTENARWVHEKVRNRHVEPEIFKRTPILCPSIIRNFILSLKDIQLKVLQAQMLG